MNFLFDVLIALPAVGYVLSLVVPPSRETFISRVAFVSVGMHMILAVVWTGTWWWHGGGPYNTKWLTLFENGSFKFFLDFQYDGITATFLLVGAFLTFLVTVYSRYYLHRESGYKRFFNTILFFYLGYNLVIASGNLETLFVGWEVLGVSSFLLIAFYRDRYLPVKNAVKVFSIYRVGDVGLILAIWLTHHLFHQNVTFVELGTSNAGHDQLATHTGVGILISIMVWLAASAKSAQFPFSTWLPRAMEGPTPSSAIFYGSLAVHLGAFLLLRTYPFWEQQYAVRVLIVAAGITTTLVASGVARVQSSIKSQIAYSSVAQIGLIFIEVAIGWHIMALVHFAGNAFLRTYQLLVSPSAVSYLIREQFYTLGSHFMSLEERWPKKIRYSLYILCIQEWHLDSLMYRYCWNPLKWVGRQLDFLASRWAWALLTLVFAVLIACANRTWLLPPSWSAVLAEAGALVALSLALKSFTERKRTKVAWFLVIANHLWIITSVALNDELQMIEWLVYLAGIVPASVVGFFVLRKLRKVEGGFDLERFHGYSLRHPKLALTFLIASLAAMGFPITPTFVGEDLIFSHIHEEQPLLAFLVGLSFIIDGLAMIRIYARVFLGPQATSPYEVAYRSS